MSLKKGKGTCVIRCHSGEFRRVEPSYYALWSHNVRFTSSPAAAIVFPHGFMIYMSVALDLWMQETNIVVVNRLCLFRILSRSK